MICLSSVRRRGMSSSTLAQAEARDRRICDCKTNTRQLFEMARAGSSANQLNVLQPRRVERVESDHELVEIQLRGLAKKNNFRQRSRRKILERNLDGAPQPPARNVVLQVVIRLGTTENAMSATVVMVARGGGP